MQELRTAVDGLYSAFQPYRLGEHIDGCPCCVGEGDNRKIRAVPLAQLSSEQLRRYTFKAMTTWGTAHEFRHFFPRIAELISFDPDWSLELEIAIGKLRRGDWNGWPLVERSAIQAFFKAWWRCGLNCFPCHQRWQSIDEVLCAIGQAEDRLDPYLHEWLQSPGLSPKRHLAAFVIANHATLAKKGRLMSGFWEDRAVQRQQVETWLKTGEVQQALQEAASATNDPEIQAELAQALGYLDSLPCNLAQRKTLAAPSGNSSHEVH